MGNCDIRGVGMYQVCLNWRGGIMINGNGAWARHGGGSLVEFSHITHVYKKNMSSTNPHSHMGIPVIISCVKRFVLLEIHFVLHILQLNDTRLASKCGSLGFFEGHWDFPWHINPLWDGNKIWNFGALKPAQCGYFWIAMLLTLQRFWSKWYVWTRIHPPNFLCSSQNPHTWSGLLGKRGGHKVGGDEGQHTG